MPEISCPYPGIKTWETSTGAVVWRLHYESDPHKGIGPRTHVEAINRELSPWALADYNNARDKQLWVQEVEIDFEATQGARVFYMEDAATLVRSKDIGPIPQSWTRWYGLDPHPRVPHSHLWCAVDPWGDRWYYRELWPSKTYGVGRAIPEDDNRVSIKQHVQLVHWLEGKENPENQGQREVIYRRVIDYAARAFGQGTVDDEPQLNFQERYEKVSREIGQEEGWRMHFVDCVKDREAGISLVNDGLKPREIEEGGQWVKRSKIHIVEDKCPELVLQLRNNRYPQLTPVQAAVKDPIDTPLQLRAHQTDNMRYIEMDKPRFIKQTAPRSDWKPMHSGVAY